MTTDRLTTAKYATDGTRLTDCCGSYSTYDIDSGDLVCRSCYCLVPDGQGDGTEYIDTTRTVEA